ncbi:hypothetical protein CMV_026574 [Castanea mollissima]|uniref:Uncharacterized protein n=1 Tax=Castanea mollissima TaxID=60419 RepID=A0A8J4QBN8_9ROSI|nr:hypothetical protein CMV_026574 [Castanea mollissima]
MRAVIWCCLNPRATAVAKKLRSKAPRFEAHSKQQLTMALRRKLNVIVLTAFLNFTLTLGSDLHGRLFAYLPKDDEHDMDKRRNEITQLDQG